MSRWIDADKLIAELQKDEATFDKEAEDSRNDPSYTECYSDAMWSRANGIRDAIIEVYEAPSIDIPQWTPCSERLPSEYGRYLVVYPLLINKPWVSILWYGKPTFPEKDEPCFYASDDEYGDVEYNDVVAWMPLPNPYEAEQTEPYDGERSE